MKKIIFVAVLAAIALVSCKKSEIDDHPLLSKTLSQSFINQPYTYLQNKYMDSVLSYELKKQYQTYDPEKFSYEEKLEMILLLDSLKNEVIIAEAKKDASFYENLQIGLIDEINSHPYIQQFTQSFAIRDNSDENDMMICTGYSDCEDKISKFQILQYYEDGIDIFGHYASRSNLTGNEEWSYYPPELFESGGKGVRYILHAKWSKNTVEYMWNGTASTVKTNVLLAMADWKTASNNKISFSEITKNVGWNKFLWCIGCKYFLRINSSTSGNWSGYSTLGQVPWSDMVININKASYPRTYRHELGHTLGLAHEHKRPDRDTYITYYPKNVETAMESQFFKLPAGSYNYHGSTFDFNSIMLYGSYAYSKYGYEYPENTAHATLLKKDGTSFEAKSTISNTDKDVIRKIYN